MRSTLVAVARASIERGVAEGRPLAVDPSAYPEPLRERRASFVTLERGGALRGCVGSLDAERPLVVDVAENAFGAALRDPRFPPLAREELAGLSVSIAILSPLEPLRAASESDLIARLRPGVDGIVLREAARRATFLPAVWHELPDPQQFLRQLRRKAGLAEDHWSAALEIWRYTVEELA